MPTGNPGQTRVTQCRHGHEYTPENTGWSVGKGGYPTRYCRACARASSRTRRPNRGQLAGSYARRKLTPDQVAEIRALTAPCGECGQRRGPSDLELAATYDVAPSVIWMARHGKSYREVVGGR